MAQQVFPSLSAVYVENPRASKPLTWGLPDECFLRRESVPMTKSEIRALVMSKLRLGPGMLMYDLGCGSGSVPGWNAPSAATRGSEEGDMAYAEPDPVEESDLDNLNTDLDVKDRKSRVEAAVAMAVAGANYSEIADVLGYATPPLARRPRWRLVDSP